MYCLEYILLLLLHFENHAIFSYCQNVLLDSQNSKSALSDIIKKFWAFPTWLVTACLQRKRKKIFWCQSILASSSEHPLSLHSEAQLKILFINYCHLVCTVLLWSAILIYTFFSCPLFSLVKICLLTKPLLRFYTVQMYRK